MCIRDSFGPPLKKTFSKYSGIDKKGAKKQNKTMNVKEFARLMKDRKLIDKVFTNSSISKIFSYIQRTDSSEAEVMESELDYGEFLEGLAACAVFKNPDPYTVLDQRIERFLREGMKMSGSAAAPATAAAAGAAGGAAAAAATS